MAESARPTARSRKGSKREAMLDAAETLIRTAGYSGFSIREIAETVGVKTAAVHYHFPTKADLGEAAAERYRARFFEALGPAERFATSGEEPMKVFAAAFRQAYAADGKLCLCGMLAAETQALPQPVAAAARAFLSDCVDWLMRATAAASGGAAADDVERRRAQALRSVAALEGGMLLSVSLGDPSALEAAVAGVADDR